MNNNRVFNFSAGPSMLPLSVIDDAAANLANYEGCGQSVMEMSHRSKEFGKIIEDAEANLRELMNIPENYKVPVSYTHLDVYKRQTKNWFSADTASQRRDWTICFRFRVG